MSKEKKIKEVIKYFSYIIDFQEQLVVRLVQRGHQGGINPGNQEG